MKIEECQRLKGFLSISPLKITICTDHVEGEAEMGTVVAHELAHLLDYLRGNKMETREQLLCS